METYLVKKADKPLHIEVDVPGSKSITNRALLMAAMAEGESLLRGVLFSDDSKYFLQAGFGKRAGGQDSKKEGIRLCGERRDCCTFSDSISGNGGWLL